MIVTPARLYPRGCMISALLAATASLSCGQSPEAARLRYFVGEHPYSSVSVGLRGNYTVGVRATLPITSPNQNEVAFTDKYEIQLGGPFSPQRERGNCRVELRFDSKSKRYLFDFENSFENTAFSKPWVIRDLVLAYSEEKGFSGSGDIMIGDGRATVEVRITIDRSKDEHTWRVTVPDIEGSKDPRGSFGFTFGNKATSNEKK